MRRKWLILLLVIVLVVPVFAMWMRGHRGYQRKYPTDGTYYCEELGIQLAFSYPKISATYSNGESVNIYAGWGNSFLSEDTECQFLASFRWNQRKNTLTLRFLKLPFDYDPDVRYVFKCIG